MSRTYRFFSPLSEAIISPLKKIVGIPQPFVCLLRLELPYSIYIFSDGGNECHHHRWLPFSTDFDRVGIKRRQLLYCSKQLRYWRGMTGLIPRQVYFSKMAIIYTYGVWYRGLISHGVLLVILFFSTWRRLTQLPIIISKRVLFFFIICSCRFSINFISWCYSSLRFGWWEICDESVRSTRYSSFPPVATRMIIVGYTLNEVHTGVAISSLGSFSFSRRPRR